MPEYVLAGSVENDLGKIADYTIDRWGADQARRYGAALDAHFEALASQDAKTKLVFENWPELQVSRCQHHYVFSLRRSPSPLAILAVFHEKMDLPSRLRERLDVEKEFEHLKGKQPDFIEYLSNGPDLSEIDLERD